MTSLFTSWTLSLANVGQPGDAKGRADIAGKLVLPLALHLRLDRHRLEGLDPGDALNQKRLVLGAALKLLVEALPEQRRRASRYGDIERKRTEHDASEQRRIEKHHRQEHDREHQIDDHRERRAGEKIADVLELAHARHRIADPARLEIGDRQREQVPEQARAKLDVDAGRGVGEYVGAQNAENGLEQPDAHQADHQHVKGADGAMHQHLVDHDLKEQRGDEGESLKEEGCNQHLRQDAPIFVNGAEKPADVETAGQIDESGAPRHQDERAVPDRFKLLARHQRRARGTRRLNEDLGVVRLANEQEAAILERGNGGQRRARKP
jgi:hypothetical protein